MEDFKIKLAAECCIRFNGKVLMQQRPLNAGTYPGYLTIPGGHIDLNEDPYSAIIREVYEETGIKIEKESLKLSLNAINYHLDKKIVFVVFGFEVNLSEEPELISSDEGELIWKDEEFVRTDKSVVPPVKLYLKHILANTGKILSMSAQLTNGEIIKVVSQNTI